MRVLTTVAPLTVSVPLKNQVLSQNEWVMDNNTLQPYIIPCFRKKSIEEISEGEQAFGGNEKHF
jgi:hypothetical protein